MKNSIILALLALLIILPARAQIGFSDSLRISLLTCSPGPDAYERFGHTAIRVKDQKQADLDLTFHYGVFSFNAPNFIYRFVKGETDYQLGAQFTADFVEGYRRRGLGMIEQQLHLDSAQCQLLVEKLLINYRPENRTYRYSYFFDNCATRPFNLFNLITGNTIAYDTAKVKAITLREMVQEKTGISNWLDFGIALAVAKRSDEIATFHEQMFLPDYLMKAFDQAQIPSLVGNSTWMTPLVERKGTLLEMQPEVATAIAAPDAIKPNSVFGILLMIALLISGLEYSSMHKSGRKAKSVRLLANSFDTLLLLFIGLTGCIVWFLNFFSLHPAVDHNINCFWLLPTHVIMAILLWFNKMSKVCRIYFGITFAMIILYVVLDWITAQYCPLVFLLLLSALLLRSFMRFGLFPTQNK